VSAGVPGLNPEGLVCITEWFNTLGIKPWCSRIKTNKNFDILYLHIWYVNIMSLTPVSRVSMKLLKSQKEEQLRLANVEKAVQRIYTQAIRAAETTTDTRYQYRLTSPPWGPEMARLTAMASRGELLDEHSIRRHAYTNSSQSKLIDGLPLDFYKDNMADILTTLQSLFPECSVTYTHMVKAPDGKMYDIETLDKTVLPFVQAYNSESFIVVDWS